MSPLPVSVGIKLHQSSDGRMMVSGTVISKSLYSIVLATFGEVSGRCIQMKAQGLSDRRTK